MARPQRGQGLTGLCRWKLVLLQREGCSGISGSDAYGLQRKGTLPYPAGSARDVDASGRCGWKVIPARPRHDLRVRRSRKEIKRFTQRRKEAKHAKAALILLLRALLLCVFA